MAHAHQWHHMAGLNFPLSLNRSWREPSTTWGALISSKPNQWMHDRTLIHHYFNHESIVKKPLFPARNYDELAFLVAKFLVTSPLIQQSLLDSVVMCDLRSWTWRSDASSLAWWRDSTYATPWTSSGCGIRPAYPMDPVRHRPSGFAWNDTRRSKTSRGLVPPGMKMK